MRRSSALLLAALGILMLASVASAQTDDPIPPPLGEHALAHKYVWSTLGPAGIVNGALSAAFEQWRDAPESWPSDTGGYLQRWASEYSASAIGSTTKYAVARAMHQDPSFVRCACTGTGRRLRHAIAAPFMARTQAGEWKFSPATVAGIAAQHVVPAATWYPAPRGVRDGVAHVLTGVLSKMTVDVMREFILPKLKPTLHD